MLHVSVERVVDRAEKEKRLPGVGALWVDDPMGGTTMHPRVFTLATFLMIIGCGSEINDEMLPEIYARIALYERLFEPVYRNGQGEHEPVTLELLQDWKGLSINGTAPEDRLRWLGRMFESFASNLDVKVSASTSPIDEQCRDYGYPFMTHVYEHMVERGIGADTIQDLLEEEDVPYTLSDHFSYLSRGLDRLEEHLAEVERERIERRD